MSLQNAKSIKYAVNGEMHARQGAMIAFRGNLQFERKGQGVGGMLKRAITGEGLPLMAVRGQGEAWFAHEAANCFIVEHRAGRRAHHQRPQRPVLRPDALATRSRW